MHHVPCKYRSTQAALLVAACACGGHQLRKFPLPLCSIGNHPGGSGPEWAQGGLSADAAFPSPPLTRKVRHLVVNGHLAVALAALQALYRVHR